MTLPLRQPSTEAADGSLVLFADLLVTGEEERLH